MLSPLTWLVGFSSIYILTHLLQVGACNAIFPFNIIGSSWPSVGTNQVHPTPVSRIASSNTVQWFWILLECVLHIPGGTGSKGTSFSSRQELCEGSWVKKESTGLLYNITEQWTTLPPFSRWKPNGSTAEWMGIKTMLQETHKIKNCYDFDFGYGFTIILYSGQCWLDKNKLKENPQ